MPSAKPSSYRSAAGSGRAEMGSGVGSRVEPGSSIEVELGAVAGANGLYVSKWGNGVLGFPLVYVLCALGANVAAAWTHREWLPCILLGWYAGGAYWDFLGVRPPPSFTGIPITIEKTRLGIASTQKSPP